MTMIDFDVWENIKGFMHKSEAVRLYEISFEASIKGPIIEIGSYCGKSAYVIGSACKQNDSVLFSVDHHKGSEEQQKGEEYFDSELYDERLERVNTLPFFEATLAETGLEKTVVPVVSASEVAGKKWAAPISMLFIDGGHSFEAAHADYQTWSQHIQPGGFLVIHDIFYHPDEGGQAPRQVYEIALKSKIYEELEMVKTLGVLRKTA